MNEFSQMIELVKQELLRGDAQMEVLGHILSSFEPDRKDRSWRWWQSRRY